MWKHESGRDWRCWLIGFMAGAVAFSLGYWLIDRYL
jgi:hypothetical protein